MKGLLGILVFIVCIKGINFAQEDKKNPVIHLLNHNGRVATISWDGNKYVEPANSQVVNFPQQLVKNNKGLYAALNGSGELYKASQQNKGVVFKRIDSTVYFGSNFDSFIFSYHDTIYSLGGYGFWKTNGLLRYYIEQRHEWEIIKLNKEVPLKIGNAYDLIWYDQLNGKIYFGFIKEGPSTTTNKDSENSIHYETIVLDLVKKEWLNLGTLSPFLKNDLTNITNISSSPFGQMIAFRTKNLVLDYSKNKIYRLSDAKQRELEELSTSTGNNHVNYFIDSTFFSWLSSKDLVDSLVFEKKDLILLDEKIYSEVPSISIDSKPGNNGKKYLVLILSGLLVAGAGYYFWKKKKLQDSFPKRQEENDNGFTIAFSPLELDLLNTILNNSSKGAYTSIEEVNKALGVSKKNIETQKKQRSDIITTINRKYAYSKRTQQELIEKRRTEFDKRSFEYFINSLRLLDAKEIIK
ncbi:MAG: hypothetical protein ABIP79_09740 [Chitinophagaceae bacterium]